MKLKLHFYFFNNTSKQDCLWRVCGVCYSTFYDAVFACINACVVAREMLCAVVLSMVCVTKNLCKQKEKTKFYFFVCVIKSWLINC